FSACRLVLSVPLPATRSPEIYTLSLHDALPIYLSPRGRGRPRGGGHGRGRRPAPGGVGVVFGSGADAGGRLLGGPVPAGRAPDRSEEHTSELQSRENLVCRLLLEKKKKAQPTAH